jgi:hypothetical protein
MTDSEYLAMCERVGEEVNRLKAQNAQLIAALEEMLDAKPQCDCSPHSGCSAALARHNARAALAAATGGTGE